MSIELDRAIELAQHNISLSREDILRSFGSAMGNSVDMNPEYDAARESAYVAGYRKAAQHIATQLRAYKLFRESSVPSS